MTSEQFNAVFDDTVARARVVLCSKATEYAAGDDRLHNFHRAAELQGCTPIRALGGMMVKHTVSVYDLIARADAGVAIPAELWDEKIVDSINYLILLRALTLDPAKVQPDAQSQPDSLRGGIGGDKQKQAHFSARSGQSS